MSRGEWNPPRCVPLLFTSAAAIGSNIVSTSSSIAFAVKFVLRFYDRVLSQYTPDPFVIAILLSLAALAVVPLTTECGWVEAVQIWGDGFWSLSQFTMQMVMILVGGFVVARAPLVQAALQSLCRIARTPAQAVIVCTVLSMTGSWLNWGFGLVLGAFVAVEMHRRVPTASFRTLVASSYSGFIVWHSGLSGSVPLSVNTPGDPSLETLGGVTVPTSQTLWSTTNLVALAAIAVALPLLNVLLAHQTEDDSELKPGPAMGGHRKEPAQDSSHERSRLLRILEESFLLSTLLAVAIAWHVGIQIVTGTFSLSLFTICLMLFGLGLLLQGSPRRFIDAVIESCPRVGPLLIQYPLYAALMALLKESGAALAISEWFVARSSAQTFPLMSFLSAGFLNLLIPSGGGQWQLQAPVVLEAASVLQVEPARAMMAVAWGDAWTNLAQPFWAVPVLAIAGLRVRDILGHCLVVLVVTGLILGTVFLFV